MSEITIDKAIIAKLVLALEELAMSIGDEYGGDYDSPGEAVEWAIYDGNRGLYAAYLAAKSSLLGTPADKDHFHDEPQREN